MRVHVSEAAADKLRGTKFILQERGKVEVKVCCGEVEPMGVPECCDGVGTVVMVWVLDGGGA